MKTITIDCNYKYKTVRVKKMHTIQNYRDYESVGMKGDGEADMLI